MPSIDEVAQQIVAADLPVLFADTCVLLDVIRSIARREKGFPAEAQELHVAASSVPPRCLVVVSHLVKHEWHANSQNVLNEAERHLVELEDSASRFHDACDAFGVVPGFVRARYSACDIASKLHDLSQRILDLAMVVDHDDACAGRAFNRIQHEVPPSRKGGEAKDCAILEQCLAVAQRLPAANFRKKRVFCTSNNQDFCKGGKLHPVLAEEFIPLGLAFCSNLAWAVHEVMH